MHLNLLFSVVLLGIAYLHPFHVSVMDAEYNAERQTLQVSHRLFLDDLEVGLKDFHGLDYIDTTEPEDPKRLDSLIASYLKAKVFFVVDDQDKSFQYIGSELEGDARWCYYELNSIENLKSIAITNVALMDVFEDQQNIVHVKVDGKMQSYKLDKGDKVKTFNFQN